MKPGKRKIRHILQAANLLALLLLLLVYLLHCVDKQTGTVYQRVKDTPVERYALRALPLLWRHRSFLERQAMKATLSPQERMESKLILKRMAHIRPTHLVQLESGKHLFGKLKHLGESAYELEEFDGTLVRQHPLSGDKIVARKPLVLPAVPFDARDLRFLISHDAANHFDLPPYLFATDGSFPHALENYTRLSQLRDEFRKTFGPLLSQRSEEGRIHIRLFESMQDFMATATSFESVNLVNAAAFFNKADNTFYIYTPLRVGNLSPSPIDFSTARHEGAHHLAHLFSLWKGFDHIPFWLNEGLAQYCETNPFGDDQEEKLALLRRASSEGQRIQLRLLVELPHDAPDRLSARRLKIAYAESWVLVRHLMKEKYRLRFFSYILSTPDSSEHALPHNSGLRLANILETTFAKLALEIQAELTEQVVPSQ